MENLNPLLYPAIFYRKSTRGFAGSPLAGSKIENLKAFMKDSVPLLPGELAAFEIQPHKGSSMKIAAYAKKEQAAYINMAFMLQQMDLYCQSIGIGAFWNGTVRASAKQLDGLPYGICLVFGPVKESFARKSASEFNRKAPQQITGSPGLGFIEAARLAPSARNRQPWFLACGDGQIDFYSQKGSFLDNTLLKGMNWYDIGICVCHTVLALQNEGLSPKAEIRQDAPEKEWYEYQISLYY
ncbi:MAG: hypothetical protein FWG10_00225 [Eubacteriaceae bacterium]|nr:hypothetical protein [Eubacteriaceae bacterium]